MHIRQLVKRTGIPERQVRYLIAEGFVPAPRGGRARADYGEDHVCAIDRYRRLRQTGFPPAAIRLLLQAREGAPFVLAPGITLVIDAGLFGSGMPVGPLVNKAGEILNETLQEMNHANGSGYAKRKD